LVECDLSTFDLHKPGRLKILPIQLNEPAQPGKLNSVNASYVIKTLKKAATLCQEKKANAIVTGPVHKGVLNKSGITFTGHTEFFAQHCHVNHTVMLFVVDQLKIALTTTHLPLAKVSQAITKERLKLTLSILNDELKNRF